MKRFALLLFIATAASAADLTNFERILFPAWIPIPIGGADGSRWTAEATVHNPGPDAVSVYPVVVASGRDIGRIEPGTSWAMNFAPNSFLAIGDGSQDDILGRLAFVPRDHADALVYADRVGDTELPVVHERDLRTSLALADVPLDSRFRLMLRVYDPFQTPNAQVRVRFWSIWPATNTGLLAFTSQPPLLLGERTLTLKVRPLPSNDVSVEPGYSQLAFDRTMLVDPPPWSNTGAVSVQIEPLTAGLRLWAFITVTENATQRVRTITPH